jgi:hypothetical protein
MKITADATISLHLIVYGKIWNASILHALFDYVHLDTNCTQEIAACKHTFKQSFNRCQETAWSL